MIKKYNSAAFTDEQIAEANHTTDLVEALLDAIATVKKWPVDAAGYGAAQEHVVLWQAAVDKELNG